MLGAVQRLPPSHVGTLLGGIVGQAIAREDYVKDCMQARGYEKVPRKKK